MNQFINPLEVLGLNSNDELSVEKIKKAKKRLIADIELSDEGHIEYDGVKITRSDCEVLIDLIEGDNSKTVNFYRYLIDNDPLNRYLISGDESVFESFSKDSIHSLPEFVDFISPYFSFQLSNSYLKAFKKENKDKILSFGRALNLLNKKDYNAAFFKLDAYLSSKIEEINALNQSIKNEEREYEPEEFEDVLKDIKTWFPIECLNSLPDYFLSKRNKIAEDLNYLTLSILNEYDETQICVNILGHFLSLELESVSRPTYEKNLKIISKRNENKIIQEDNAPILSKWAKFLLDIKKKKDSLEKSEINPQDVKDFLFGKMFTKELNSLPSFGDEIRDEIAYSIRSLSISCWNDHSDMKIALELIALAELIESSEEAQNRITQDKTELLELQKKYKGVLVCHFCNKNPPEDGYELKETIYKETYRSVLGRKVEYKYVTMTFPRCSSCDAIHSDIGDNALKVNIVGTIVGAIIGYMIDEHWIIGGIAGLIVSLIISAQIKSSKSKEHGVKLNSVSELENHPLMKQRVKEGWTFTKPSA